MDNCRHNTQRRWHNLREDNNIVDVGLFEGDTTTFLITRLGC